jgi:hypothetical protein
MIHCHHLHQAAHRLPKHLHRAIADGHVFLAIRRAGGLDEKLQVIEEDPELEFLTVERGPPLAALANVRLGRPIAAGIVFEASDQMISALEQGQDDFAAGVIRVRDQIHRFG